MTAIFPEAIGMIAGSLTTIAFLPQVIRLYRTKSAKDISWPMIILFNIGVILWAVYGFMIVNGLPLILANIIVTLLTALIIMMKIRYDKKGRC